MGQGAVFAHVVFDMYGHSPLVRHYLERRGLLQTAGYTILVKRTELDKLPPYPFEIHYLIEIEFLDYIVLLRHLLIKIFCVNPPKLARLHMLILTGEQDNRTLCVTMGTCCFPETILSRCKH